MPVLRRTSWINWRCCFPFLPPSTLSPSTSMIPAEGSSRKFVQRNKVLFPEPLRPMIQTTSRGSTSRDILFRTCNVPNHFCNLETRMIGSTFIGLGHSFFESALEPGGNDGQNPIRGRGDDEHLHVFA